jgi:very-short-patch-repair endonuclease
MESTQETRIDLLTPRVLEAMEGWQSELLDLSRGNRLLSLKAGRGAPLRLSHPEPESLFAGLVNEGNGFKIYRPDSLEDNAPVEDQLALVLDADEQAVSSDTNPPTSRLPLPNEIKIDGDPKKIESALYRLRLRARSALVEQGIDVLYVTFGMLHWHESDASHAEASSPLLLVPVRLTRETALHPYSVQPIDDRPILNPALVLKLRRDFGLTLDLPDETDEDVGLTQYLNNLSMAISAQPAWSVSADSHLGLFSFAKHAMYADLAANRDRLCRHPIVRAVAREDTGLPDFTGSIPSESQLDGVSPAKTFQVVDADASQRVAIAAVASGANLVIHGPPGTGKSQTITNIIAECLARRKKVLFVSEKMAALRVVAARLEQAGLKEFCLEAHSQAIKPGDVIKALAATLDAGNGHPGVQPEREHEELSLKRDELNQYASALHDRRDPLNRSVYQIHGELALRSKSPRAIFEVVDIGSLTQERLTRLLEVVRRLAQVGGVVLDPLNHPWNGCLLSQFDPLTQARLDDLLARLTTDAANLAQNQEQSRAEWGLDSGDSIADAMQLSRVLAALEAAPPDLPPAWLSRTLFERVHALAVQGRDWTREYLRRRASLLAHYDETLLQAPLESLLEHLRAGGAPSSDRLHGPGEKADVAVREQAEIGKASQRAADAVVTVTRQAEGVARQLQLKPSTALKSVQRLIQIARIVLTDPRPGRDWFDRDRWHLLLELAEEAERHVHAGLEARGMLEGQFEDAFFGLDHAELYRRFQSTYGSWTRYFSPQYYRDIGQVRGCARPGTSMNVDEVVSSLSMALRLNASDLWLSEHRRELAGAFLGHYEGKQTDWGEVRSALGSVRQLSELFRPQQVPELLIDALVEGFDRDALSGAVSPLAQAFEEAQASLSALARLVSLDRLPFEAESVDDAPMQILSRWILWWRDGLTPLWEAARTMIRLRRGMPCSVRQMAHDISEARALIDIQRRLAEIDREMRNHLGPFYSGLATDWDALFQALDWAQDLLALFDGDPPLSFIEAFRHGHAIQPSAQGAIDAGVENTRSVLERLRPMFESNTFIVSTLAVMDTSLRQIAAWAHRQQADLPRLQEWADYRQTLRDATDAGLVEFVESVRRGNFAPGHWEDTFLKQTYTLWLAEQYRRQPNLPRFRRERHEEAIAQFSERDRGQWKTATRQIAALLAADRPPAGPGLHPKSELAILRREATKKKRFRPLRKLFADLPNLLPVLKPCMLMSPLAVAQYLGESALEFDLVIFDEASQIVPSDAIGAIGRGKQLVVVGDQHQLPPTRFFSASSASIDDEDDEQEEAPESILDACRAANFRDARLRWHYRSRHEDLIAFSNRYIYGNNLMTFPSPASGDRAVQFVHASDGLYQGGTGKGVNVLEARRVADLVIEHIRASGRKSLGVITFSQAQMVAVQMELDRRKRAQPELEALLSEDGDQGFFIKNLENVQGDERDVILFSVGYGPNAMGKLSLNFGPLNKAGGERRLNVAITRARDLVKIVASFRPQDLDTRGSKSQGLHLLRKYLEFAEQGPVTLMREITSEGGEPDSPFEEAVLIALEAQGLEVVPQVGVGGYRIDIGVRDQDTGRYLLGIECDGAAYHSSKTARDRDRLRQQVLEGLGWRIHRIWSTDWIKDPEGEVRRVLDAVEAARSDADSEQIPFTKPLVPSIDDLADAGVPTTGPSVIPPEPPTVGGDHRMQPIALPYERADLPASGTKEEFYGPSSHTLGRLVARCVEVESPVHENRVIQAVRECYGISGAGNRVRDKILAAIRTAARSNIVVQRGEFVWHPRMEKPPVRSLDATGKARPIQEVAIEEIQEAALAILEAQFSLGRDDLIVAVARELGYGRTGGVVSSRIGVALDTLEQSDAVVNVGGQVKRSG